MRTHLLAASIVLGLALPTVIATITARAAPSDTQVIPYQGHLDQGGAPKDGPVTLILALYGVPSDGMPLWTGTYPVTLVRGRFALDLGGGGQPLTSNVWRASELFLEVTVDGTLLQGRQRIAAMPYAARAVPGVPFLGETVEATSFQGQTFTGGSFSGSFSGLGIVPIGSVTAWMPDAVNPSLRTPLGDPPLGWAYCNGDTVPVPPGGPLDPDGNGQFTTPNLNGDAGRNQGGRFLRGGDTSGVIQADSFLEHRHLTHAQGAFNGFYLSNDNTAYSGGGGDSFGRRAGDADPDLRTGLTGGVETRPANVSVVWIMRIQ